jgi:hypothetical protein
VEPLEHVRHGGPEGGDFKVFGRGRDVLPELGNQLVEDRGEAVDRLSPRLNPAVVRLRVPTL